MTDFDFPRRSVTAKLRKLGYDVPKKPGAAPVFSADETEALASFLTDNSGNLTAEEISEAFADGKFTARQINGKALSLEMTGHSKADPYAGIEDMLEQTVEEIATAFDKTVRGVKTVLTRRGLSCADYAPKAAGE